MPDAAAPAAALPALVLGGTGYVAGELLRLLAGHPVFRVETVVSTSQAGTRVTDAFPHLAGTACDGLCFAPQELAHERVAAGGPLALFAAAPHGATAPLVDALLATAERAGTELRIVDTSADFRFADPERYAAVYGHPHPAPARLALFRCALPEHHVGGPPRHAAQPGCFTTAVTLAAYPLLASGLCAPDVFVSAVTGSSGAGRTPAQGTHHPERRSALYAYAPLAHRHEAEMRLLLAPACGGGEPDLAFVPHSGPFVRGIHATLRFTLRRPVPAATLADAVNAFYEGTPFVRATTAPPKLTEVVGTNRCRIGISTRGTVAVALSVIDNLVKGAAGGAVQWGNRLFGLPDDTGLRLAGLGWY